MMLILSFPGALSFNLSLQVGDQGEAFNLWSTLSPTESPAALGTVGDAGGGVYTLLALPGWVGPRAILRWPPYHRQIQKTGLEDTQGAQGQPESQEKLTWALWMTNKFALVYKKQYFGNLEE